jgi:hypothetical protein
MTHTLHRQGEPAGLCNDFVLLVMPARGINLEGSQEAMQQVWEIISHHSQGLSNFGNLTQGNSLRTNFQQLMKSTSRLAHAVFVQKEALKACVAELKAAALGPSVVISGLYDEIVDICRDLGVKPHTVNLSLGIHGRTEKLPPPPILEITTMCGHALVSAELVREKIESVARGELSPERAALQLSELCECGIFNPARAENLVRTLSTARK